MANAATPTREARKGYALAIAVAVVTVILCVIVSKICVRAGYSEGVAENVSIVLWLLLLALAASVGAKLIRRSASPALFNGFRRVLVALLIAVSLVVVAVFGFNWYLQKKLSERDARNRRIFGCLQDAADCTER